MSDLPDGNREAAETNADEELDPGEIEEAEGGDEEDAADGEGDGEDAGSEADEDAEGQARQVAPRRESRRARLGRENAELRERIARLEGANEAQRRQPQGPAADPQQAQREEQAFRESLELMTPGQAALAVADRREQRIGAAFAQMQAQTRDEIQREAFNAKADRGGAYGQYRDKVIAAIEAERARGNYAVTYEAAFRYLVGEDVIRKTERAGTRQAKNGAARVRQQTTRPTNGRGDGARPSARPAADSYEADLALVNDAVKRGIPIL
jgi:hypothetical protein